MSTIRSNHPATGGRRLAQLALLALLTLTLALAGCGDDDDDSSPTGPTNPGGSDFDQTTAVTQSQVAAPQGVALVESMDDLAAGFTRAAKDYAYNGDNERWEYDASWTQGGYTYNWFYTVQYLDGDGNPQQEGGTAASAIHTMDGSGSFSQSEGGVTIDYDYRYVYDVTLTGLATDTVVMNGTGSIGIDYTYSGNGIEQSDTYAMAWETLGGGVSYPASGCPSGTIRYDMAPYYMDLVFDGSSTAQATVYDANGTAVSGGNSDHTVSCSR